MKQKENKQTISHVFLIETVCVSCIWQHNLKLICNIIIWNWNENVYTKKKMKWIISSRFIAAASSWRYLRFLFLLFWKEKNEANANQSFDVHFTMLYRCFAEFIIKFYYIHLNYVYTDTGTHVNIMIDYPKSYIDKLIKSYFIKQFNILFFTTHFRYYILFFIK